MTIIALIHALWLLLLPIGIVVAIRGALRRRTIGLLGGGILVFVSLPAVTFCTQMWPLDFLIPRAEMRVPVAAGAYTISLVQKPGVDFYDSFLEVRRADGKVTRVMIDADDNKWWRPRVVVKGRRAYFVRASEGVTPKTSFVDAGDGTLFSGYYGQTYNLKDLSFEEP